METNNNLNIEFLNSLVMNYIYFNVIKITKLKKGKWP